MNKAEVIERLTERLGDKKVAATAVDGVLDIFNRALAKGEKVSLSGFGTFEKVDRPARKGRNPRTGETVKVKKSSAVKFRSGTGLKAVVNGQTKLGREPKHEPLLPEGITSARFQKNLARLLEQAEAPATATRTRTPRAASDKAEGSTTAAKAPAKAAAKAPAQRATKAAAPAAEKSDAPAKSTAAAKAPAKRATKAAAPAAESSSSSESTAATKAPAKAAKKTGSFKAPAPKTAAKRKAAPKAAAKSEATADA